MNFIFASVALILLAICAVLLYISLAGSTENTEQHEPYTNKSTKSHSKSNYKELMDVWWQKAGFSYSPIENLGVLAVVAAITYVSFKVFGYSGMLVGASSSVLFMLLVAQWRRSNTERRLTQQLPSFIDQVSRRMKVGMNIQKAIEQSAKTTQNPLKLVLERVEQRERIGIELQHAFYKEYLITGVTAFRILGSVFNINARFGGSINDSLDSLVKLLRQQEQSKRELRSITGETRITAWVIGSAPLLVGAYMLWKNPSLLLDMWASEGGRVAIQFGLGMQAVGVVLIWRMFRSL